MSQVVSELFVDEKQDAALDSGVCPSPDESYQSYFDAFPALSSFSNTTNGNLFRHVHCTKRVDPPTPPPVWYPAQKMDDDTGSKTQLRYKSFSSPPTDSRPAGSPAFLPPIRNTSKSCGSAPSPTNSGATPNKRPKLVDQPKATQEDGLRGSKCNAVRSYPKLGYHANQHHQQQQQQHSCPDLLAEKHSPFYQLPEFCCPQVTRGLDAHLAMSVPFNGGLSTSHHASSGASPQFVVPKCFKVGSWPGGKMDKPPVASDVPLWPCGQWFCTLHKSVQLGLLSAKVQRQAAKILTPNVCRPSNVANVLPSYANQFVLLPPNDDDDDAEDYCNSVDYGSVDDYGNVVDYLRYGNVVDYSNADDNLSINGYCNVDDYSNFNVNVVENSKVAMDGGDAVVNNDGGDGAFAMPPPPTVDDVGVFDVDDEGGPATTLEFFDAPQFILHLINKDNDPPSPNESTFLPKVSSSWTDMQTKNANADNFVDLNTFWPDVPMEDHLNNNHVPEFDFFPPVHQMENGKLASSISSQNFFDPAQEVGFCLPKLDLPTNKTNFGNHAELPYLHEKSPIFQEQQKQKVQQNDTSSLLNNEKAPKRSQALAVPISPDTHFVPIKSESMEDAYFLKPGFDETSLKGLFGEHKNCKGLAYLAETDYYIYLEQPGQLEATMETPRNKTKGAPVIKPCLLRNVAIQPTAFNLKPGCDGFNSLPLKFRALKPGKMVQTEEEGFEEITKKEEKYLKMLKTNEKYLKMMQQGEKFFLNDADDDDWMFDDVTAAVRASHADLIDAADQPSGVDDGVVPRDDKPENRGLQNADFEIWACYSGPLAASAFSKQFVWYNGDKQNSNFRKQSSNDRGDAGEPWTSDGLGDTGANKLASGCSTNNDHQYNYLASTTSTTTNNNNHVEMEMWQKQDERDEELLLKYVSSISLISPLELTTCGDCGDG